MSFQKTINIAIFGLSLRALNELKEQVQKAIPNDISINWTNVSEPDLNALLINDLFFNTPSIQNLIKTNHLSVLRVVNTSQKDSIIENGILHLPIINQVPLQEWLSQTVLHRVKDHQALDKPKFKPAHDNQDKQKFLEELLNPMNGKIQIFDASGQLGIADARAQWFWKDPHRVKQNTDATLNFTYATMSDSVKLAKVNHQDLKFWLWNLLWKSPEFLVISPENGGFQLKYWPQPEEGFDRRDILRMSACFAQGAQISHVVSHLDIPLERVQQFVAASLGANLIYPIANSKVKFSPNKDLNQSSTGTIKSFFGSLRKRLGL